MRLEDSLKGGYAGLYHEVVTDDCYRLRELKFKPDVIFDIGANVGVFARHARSLFPEARIVSVEPDIANVSVYMEHFPDGETELLQVALGKGRVYHGLTANNGSGETYISAGLGYPQALLDAHVELSPEEIEVVDVKAHSLEFIMLGQIEEGESCMLKIDCEGAENCIWGHKESMICLAQADYICMELHYHAQHGGLMDAVRQATQKGIEKLMETHYVEINHPHLYARKKL